jgi:hypothetical protein
VFGEPPDLSPRGTVAGLNQAALSAGDGLLVPPELDGGNLAGDSIPPVSSQLVLKAVPGQQELLGVRSQEMDKHGVQVAKVVQAW